MEQSKLFCEIHSWFKIVLIKTVKLIGFQGVLVPMVFFFYVYRRTQERFCDLKLKSIRESAWNFKQNGNIQCFLEGTENLKREDESFRFRQGWLNKRLKVWITESRQFLMRVLNCGG